jgi:hypothetical protein
MVLRRRGQQVRMFGRADVFREHVVGARRLEPALALAEGADRLVIEAAAHSSGEHVGVNERGAVPMRRRAGSGRKVNDYRRESPFASCG